MKNRLERDVRKWLEAERLSADELAEQALARVFMEIGRTEPEAGFADRVLLRAGRFAPSAGAWGSRWLRAAVAMAILVVGLACVTLPTWWLVADPLARSLGSPLGAFLTRGVARSLSVSFAAWSLIQDVGTALRASLVTPTAVGLLTANLLLACASLFGLKRLLRAPEELVS